MTFDNKAYWDRRRKGYRGLAPTQGTKEFEYEQRKIDKVARQLWLEKQRGKEAKKEGL